MIRAEQLTKVFGSQPAVDAVSFEIGRGEVVGFLGRNGAGKSTTLRMLCGVLEPDRGQVWIDGLPVRGDDPRPRARIGYLPEGTPLYGAMRVLDYLHFAAAVKGLDRRAARAARRDAVARCGLSGWETRRIDSLSKGYRQRVGLAQALLGDPPVLVLDEPSSGLDPAEVVRIRALVRELGRTRTVLLSTHVLREVDELCTRVLILAGGRLVADGSPSALCQRLGVRLRVRARGALALLERCAAAAGIERALATEQAGLACLEGSAREPEQAAARVAAALAESGCELVELAHVQPSLEDVFLERTQAASA